MTTIIILFLIISCVLAIVTVLARYYYTVYKILYRAYMEDNNMDDNRCVCCGEIIPEGRQVCPQCDCKSIESESKNNKCQERK